MITKEIVYQEGDKVLKILPYDGLKITCNIEFDHDLIQNQEYSIKLSPEKFVNEIASARTFGFLEQVAQLQENGYALGGSLDNAVVIDGQGVMNKEGLRFTDEFVRHKVLDLVGDLALLGWPLLGHVIAEKSGHGLNFGLMKEIASHPECWQIVELENGEAGILEKLVKTTRSAGNKIIPFMVPPTDFADASCVA